MNDEQFAEIVRGIKQQYNNALLRKSAEQARKDVELTLQSAVNQAVTEVNEYMAMYQHGQIHLCEYLNMVNMLSV